MAKQINSGVGGVVKAVKSVPVGISGVVKNLKEGWCGIGGVVKQFFSSGFVLYDNGNNIAGFTGTSYVTFNSDHIYTYNLGDEAIQLTDKSISIDKYSKLCVEVMFTQRYGTYYMGLMCNLIKKTGSVNNYFWDVSCDTLNSKVIIKLDISELSGTVTGLKMGYLIRSKSNTGGNSYTKPSGFGTNVKAETYRIWLEE